MNKIYDIFKTELKIKTSSEESRVLSKVIIRVEKSLKDINKRSNQEIENYKCDLKEIIQDFMFNLNDINKKHNVKEDNRKISLLEEEFLES